MKQSVSLAEYLPDQGDLGGGLVLARNCYPITTGYGPARDFSSQTDSLDFPFAGGASFLSADGSTRLLVGTNDGLKLLDGSTWLNQVSGLTITGQWRFAQFGEFAVGVNGVKTQVTNFVGGGTTPLTGAPAGWCIAIVGDYVVIGGDIADRLSIRTSGFNNHTQWDVATTTATYQPMLTGGEVMGLAGGEYGVILQRERLVRMTRSGDSTAPFSYDEISASVGCASRGSVCQLGRTVFFLSDKGFMALEDGQTVTPIGVEKVDREFIRQVARDDYDTIYSAVDPQNKVVIWCVPGRPGALWVYNYVLKRWSVINFRIEGIFPGYTNSTSLEALAVSSPNIDALTISLDDARWEGGAPRLYAVRDRQIGSLTGATLKAEFQGSFMQLAGNGVCRVRSLRPITDATAGHSMTLNMRSRMGDDGRSVNASSIRDSGVMPIRCSGRYTQPYWSIDAEQAWTFAQGFEVDFEQAGER